MTAAPIVLDRLPELIASAYAPGRVCLAGESLDWMTGGPSVVAAVPVHTTVTVTPGRAPASGITLASSMCLPTRREVPITALGQLAGDNLDLLQATVATVAEQWAMLLAGARIEVASDIPTGAGVSSSAAVSVAAAGALMRFAGGVPSATQVAQAAYKAEAVKVGTGAGWMDFLACTHGGVCRIDATNPPRVNRLSDTLGVPLLLIDTQQRRTTARVLASKRDRWRAGEPGMRAYADTATRLVDELTTALSQTKPDYAGVGHLMSRTQDALRDLVHCSTALIDECVTRCLTNGAYGAKLTGSGHGGCLIALAPIERIGAIHAALADLPVRVMVFTVGEPHGVVFPPSDYSDY